jgi:hypothetical protein
MPAPTLTTDRIRLRVDADQKTAAQDALRGATPILWRSADVMLEVGLFYNGEVLDVSNLAALTLEIKTPGAGGTAADPEAAPLASKTVTAFDATLTAGTWADLSKQHASVGFSATEMNFALSGLAAQWLVVSLLTTAGKTITVAAGLVTVREDGYDSAGTAPVLDGSAYTKAELLALLGTAAARDVGSGAGNVLSVETPESGINRISISGETEIYFDTLGGTTGSIQMRDNGIFLEDSTAGLVTLKSLYNIAPRGGDDGLGSGDGAMGFIALHGGMPGFDLAGGNGGYISAVGGNAYAGTGGGIGGYFSANAGYVGNGGYFSANAGYQNGANGGFFAADGWADEYASCNVAGSVNVSATENGPGGVIDLSGSGISITAGNGSPEGVVTAKVGSLYLRLNGGAGTTLYVKQSGTGNTGWVGK